MASLLTDSILTERAESETASVTIHTMMPIQIISKRFCHAQQDALAFLVGFALSEVAKRFGRLDFVDAYEVYEMDLSK